MRLTDTHTPGNRVRRFAVAVGLATILTALGVAPAAAKMPFFSVEITPSEPVVGQTVVIAVRTWEDPDHTIPAPFGVPDLHGLLILRSADRGAFPVGIPLHAEQEGHFRGTIVAPAAGEWMLVPFPAQDPARERLPGYPDPIALTVQADGVLPGATVGIAGIAAAVIIGTAFIVGLRLRAGLLQPRARGRANDELRLPRAG